jgi:ferrous iron transport protein B
MGDLSIAEHIVEYLNPFGILIGLNGVILLAYILAIPANEIIIPTILMLTVLSSRMDSFGAGTGVMFELDSLEGSLAVFQAGGWTLLTAVNLMLFSLIHNPCSTTIHTIFKETGSAKWTLISSLLPVVMGLTITFFVAQIWRLVGGVG